MAQPTTIGVKVEKAIRDRLKALGRAKDRSPHWLVKKAIDEYLVREEQWEAEKRDDAERWNRYLATGEAYSLEEMRSGMRNLRDGKRPKWRR